MSRIAVPAPVAARDARGAIEEPPWAKALIIGVMVVFLALMLALPLVTVFVQALDKGLGVAARAIGDPDALAAIRLTLFTAAIVVPFNAAFGLCAAWRSPSTGFPARAS